MSTMASATEQNELQKIVSELHSLTLHRDQLLSRLNLLKMLKEFREKGGHEEEGKLDREKFTDEYENIEQQLKELSEKKLELQALQERLEGVPHNGKTFTGQSSHEIFSVESPPNFPAPRVITDITKLPREPSQILCPHCQQYVTTEVRKVNGNTTWLVCVACSFLCCLAGCCLLPFCINNFKDIQHKCPKCRSLIHTCTNL